MGKYANTVVEKTILWSVALIVIVLNVFLLQDMLK